MALFTKEDATYVNEYNSKVFETIGPILEQRQKVAEYEWLKKAMSPINL